MVLVSGALQPHKFDLNLEALRGIAAIIVVWHHLILYPYLLDPLYKPTGVFAFVAPGHLSVLVFFMLSGYVIGLTHTEALKKDTISTYLKKRFVRIYPLYFVCIVFALLVALNRYKLLTVVSNLTLLQNIVSPVIFENNPAWSLNYEVAFYLIFIPLSLFRLNTGVVALVTLLTGIIAYFSGCYLISSYCFGFVFWLVGLILARYSKPSTNTSFSLMVSMLFLLISLEKLNVFTTVISKIVIILTGGNFYFTDAQVRFLDLSYMPFCIIIILIFAGREIIFNKYLIGLLILVIGTSFCHFLRDAGALFTPDLLLPALCYLVCVLIFVFQAKLQNICNIIIVHLSKTGAISYGLYMLHFPILIVFSRIVLFSGTPFTFAIRLLCYILVCITLAYWLEKFFQPWIRKQIG